MKSPNKSLTASIKKSGSIPPNINSQLRSSPKKRSKQNLLVFVSLLIDRFQKAMPEARCELFYHTPYQLLCSVVLSAQATDKQVNKVMKPLYDHGFTPDSVFKAGEKKLLDQIKSIGLAPTKAKNIIKLTQALLENHEGEVPKTRSELEALAGVGRKTANVILGELYGEPTFAVDTHAFRVGKRLGLHRDSTPEKAEISMLKLIDEKFLPKAHHWFILHGRYTCKAQKPSCIDCILRDICPSLDS